jgi:acyl-homoserine-lactone acylase
MKAEETAVITGLTNKAALRRGLRVGAASVAMLVLVGCLGSSNNDIAGTDGRTNPNENPNLKYDVSITRTTYGVPHIRAKDYGSLGYGQGYAFAQDNLCVFLEDLLTIRGERSRFFGPLKKKAPMELPAMPGSVPATKPFPISRMWWPVMPMA